MFIRGQGSNGSYTGVSGGGTGAYQADNVQKNTVIAMIKQIIQLMYNQVQEVSVTIHQCMTIHLM